MTDLPRYDHDRDAYPTVEVEHGAAQGTTLDDLGVRQIGQAIKDMPPEPEWLVDNLIAKGGTCLFAAKPKVGKSTLARTLCAAVAKGMPFLGRDVVAGPAVYAVAEGQEQIALDHFKFMLGNDDLDSLSLHYRYGKPTGSPLAWAEKVIEGIGARLLVLDPLKAFLNGKDAIGEYDAAYDALQPYSELGNETGCAIVLLHHAKKSSGDELGDNILGSTGIYGVVDVAIMLTNSAQGRAIETPPMRYGRELEKHELFLDDFNVARLGKTIEVRVRDKVSAAIVTLLEDGQSMTAKEISESVDAGQSATVVRALTELKDQGKVVWTGRGVKGDPKRWSLKP